MYNGFNQLVSVSNDDVDAEYTYAPSGLRLTKTVDNEQIYYINDGDNVIAELYEDEVTAYYLRGLNLYGSFIGNDEYFYLYNAHGDVVNLTDTSGYIEHTYRYDAFGNEREPESSDNNPFRYCGEYYDGETGSYYLRARYYDPVIGRFTQQDSYRGDATDPLSLNYYTYCYNSPLYLVDPSGNSPETVLDFISVGVSLAEFMAAPNAVTGAYLLWDIGALAVPLVPGSYVAKGLKLANNADNLMDLSKTLKAAGNLTDVQKAFRSQNTTFVANYRQLKQMVKRLGIEDMEVHHLIEKRFNAKLGIGTTNTLSVALDAETHQKITTALRNEIGYIGDKKDLTTWTAKPKDIWRAMVNVYESKGLQHLLPEIKSYLQQHASQVNEITDWMGY